MEQIPRALLPQIRKDLEGKIVLVSGPRQSGKTTLARSITPEHEYINYDYAPYRLAIKERSWDRKKALVVFDELHKMRGWKAWLKGIYDVEGCRPGLLVTGSARLEASRKSSESLAGRFFHLRLHPFDVKELSGLMEPEQALERLMAVGGFPEPFLDGDPVFYGRWKRSHIDTMLRQDPLDLQSTRDLAAVETLIEMLRHRVGSPVSYSGLARNLERDAKTVKRWLGLLEDLYVVFSVRPYHRNVARSLLKEPKYYFFDAGQVEGGPGPRLGNACACALLKEVHRVVDTEGREPALHYLRTKDGREVDFAIVSRGQPPLMLEVKEGDDAPSESLAHFGESLPGCRRVQLVRDLAREKTYPDGLEVRRVAPWLATLTL